jgi:hypothetical protein
LSRSHLKNVFWPNIFVGASFQILDIQQYASGLKLGPAAILNQNPIFEMASADRRWVSVGRMIQRHLKEFAAQFCRRIKNKIIVRSRNCALLSSAYAYIKPASL